MKKFTALLLLYPLFFDAQSMVNQKNDLSDLSKITGYATISAISAGYSLFLFNVIHKEIKENPLFSFRTTLKIIDEYLKGRNTLYLHDQAVLENYKNLYIHNATYAQSFIDKLKYEELALKNSGRDLFKNFQRQEYNYRNLLTKMRLRSGLGLTILPVATMCGFLSYKLGKKAIAIHQKEN